MSAITTTTFLPVLIIIALALVSARYMVRNTSVSDSHKFANLDGLRGFLAVLVFIYHSVYWFNYSHLQGWSSNGSMPYINFGQTSLCFFFMLSGFLFFDKLLEHRNKELDWLGFFYARLLRLAPLYLSVVAVMLAIIAYESGFNQHEDSAVLRSSIIDWVLFTIPGHADINSVKHTQVIIPGVLLALPYEWFFYACLPFIALLLGTKSKANSGIWLILSCASIASFNRWELDLTLMYGFAGGAFAAYVVRTPWLRELFQNQGANWVVLAGLLLCYAVFDSKHNLTRLVILTTCMTFIACGANLFGALNWRAARALGTISYGVFLLHGVVLYLVLSYCIDKETMAGLTQPHYWLIIFCCTPIIIGLSALSWRWIEWPAKQFAVTLTQRVKPTATHTTTETEIETKTNG